MKVKKENSEHTGAASVHPEYDGRKIYSLYQSHSAKNKPRDKTSGSFYKFRLVTATREDQITQDSTEGISVVGTLCKCDQKSGLRLELRERDFYLLKMY